MQIEDVTTPYPSAPTPPQSLSRLKGRNRHVAPALCEAKQYANDLDRHASAARPPASPRQNGALEYFSTMTAPILRLTLEVCLYKPALSPLQLENMKYEISPRRVEPDITHSH